MRDDVEAGDERLKELEQEMKDHGVFDTDFNLGDLLEEEDEKNGDDPKLPQKKVKMVEFPSVEGEESIVEYIGQYKKACLSRKALLKNTRERLDKDKAIGYEILGFLLLLSSTHTVQLTLQKCLAELKLFSLQGLWVLGFIPPRTDLKNLEDSCGALRAPVCSQNQPSYGPLTFATQVS